MLALLAHFDQYFPEAGRLPVDFLSTRERRIFVN